MKVFQRSASVLAGLGLAGVLAGCAGPVISSSPATPEKLPGETPEHNPWALEAAIDNARDRLVSALNASAQPDGKLAKGFNAGETLQAITTHIDRNLPEPTVSFGDNKCVKKYIVLSAVWGLQASLEGTRQTSGKPEDGVMRATVHYNTWTNLTQVCGVKDPSRYTSAVQLGWNQTAQILNKLNFDYK